MPNSTFRGFLQKQKDRDQVLAKVKNKEGLMGRQTYQTKSFFPHNSLKLDPLAMLTFFK